jgi:hypothetical protein
MLKRSRRTFKWHALKVCQFGDFNDDSPTDIGGIGGLFSNEDETRFPNQGGGGSGRMEDENEEVTRLKVSDGYQDFTDKTEIEFPETGALGLLWVKEGRRKGNIYQIRDEDIVGRQSRVPFTYVPFQGGKPEVCALGLRIQKRHVCEWYPYSQCNRAERKRFDQNR